MTRLLQKFTLLSASTWAGVSELVSDAVDQYRLAACFACEERLDYLRDRGRRLPAGSSANAEESLGQKVAIASEYLQVVQDRSFVPPCVTSTGFLWVMKDVLEDKCAVF